MSRPLQRHNVFLYMRSESQGNILRSSLCESHNVLQKHPGSESSPPNSRTFRKSTFLSPLNEYCNTHAQGTTTPHNNTHTQPPPTPACLLLQPTASRDNAPASHTLQQHQPRTLAPASSHRDTVSRCSCWLASPAPWLPSHQ